MFGINVDLMLPNDNCNIELSSENWEFNVLGRELENMGKLMFEIKDHLKRAPSLSMKILPLESVIGLR